MKTAVQNKRRPARPNLDYLLAQASPSLPLYEKLQWLADLFWWIRTPGRSASSTLDFSSGQAQLARVRYLLNVLQRNPEWEVQVGRTFRSIFKETEAIDLFSRTGLPGQSSLFHEATERIFNKLLPAPPRESELGELIGDWFTGENDADWIEKIDSETIQQIGRLMFTGFTKSEVGWNHLPRDMEDAILLLVSRVRVQGLSSHIRKRSATRDLRESPFFNLVDTANEFIQTQSGRDESLQQQRYQRFMHDLNLCRRELLFVQDHLNEFGVNLEIVYQSARMEAEMQRINILSDFIYRGWVPEDIVKFFAYLVRESVNHRRVGTLLKENIQLLSRRIVERNAETGAHYITRNRSEYIQMLKKAAGGGLITGPTVILKLIAEHASLPIFIKGIFISLNYSASFVAIQLMGFTLATKQPAMTAPALAAKMDSIRSDGDLFPLISEITALVRSQFAAILGNIVLVIPCVALLHFLYTMILVSTPLSQETASQLIDGHGILSLTPFYAAITGVILWFSSLIAGAIDNWSSYRQIPLAIATSRRVQAFLGKKGANRLKSFLDKSLTPLGGNFAVGFLMGLTPKIGMFLGLPLDVRHVTLSSGVVSFAILSYGPANMSLFAWLNVFFGLISIGILNVGVSFGLALTIAINAKQIEAPKRQEIYRVLWKKILRKPMAFLLPAKN